MRRNSLQTRNHGRTRGAISTGEPQTESMNDRSVLKTFAALHQLPEDRCPFQGIRLIEIQTQLIDSFTPRELLRRRSWPI